MCSDEVHFAFYFPFSYSDCQRLLGNIDSAMASVTALQDKPLPKRRTTDPHTIASLYFHRELLTSSLEGRRVELLTITDYSGKGSNRETRPPGLFPEADTPRPHVFKGKPAVYVGARVHPGETAASYMLHGLLAFLLQPRNAYAAELRRRFVFKVVPMINPDGVFWGHFRTDTMGVNLNRQYAAPHADTMPTVYAVKEMLKQLAATYTPPPVESLRNFRDRFVHSGGGKGAAAAKGKGGPRRPAGAASRGSFAKGTFASRAAAGQSANQPSSGLWMCLDLHGYTARRGCYILANSTTPPIEARALAFANITQLYAPQFNASACSFGRGKFGPQSTAGAAGGAAPDKPPPKRAAYATPYGTDVMDKAAATAVQRSARGSRGPGAASVPFGSGAHGSNPGYDKGTASSNELWAATVAGVIDPYELRCEGVPAGLTFGKSTARLADSDASRLNREWAAHKARATARAEGNKEGAGRVTLWKELKVPHSYTVEGSCNLLNHTRVFARLYSGPALHKEMLATVGPSTTVVVQGGAAASARGVHQPRASSGLQSAGSRVLGAAGAQGGACTLVHCATAQAPLLSQVYTLPGCGPGSKWNTPSGTSLPLPAKLAASALAGDASLAPIASAGTLAAPYSCAVDALQPPPRCAFFSSPFGFHSTPPSHSAAGVAVPLYEEHFHAARQTHPGATHASAQYACGWGTCPHDPPAAFAAVGRGLAFAMLELSGGHSKVTSRLPHSVWGSLEALHRWSRRRVALAAGLPVPSDSALAEVIGPAVRARAPEAGTHVAEPPAAEIVPTPARSKDTDAASTDTGGSDSDSDASLSNLAAVQESERRAFALVRDARSPSPPTSEEEDAPVWGAFVPDVKSSSVSQPAAIAVVARASQHSFEGGSPPVHAPGGSLARRAHFGQMRPPAALDSDPAAYFSVSGVASAGGTVGSSRGGAVSARNSSAAAWQRSRRGGTAQNNSDTKPHMQLDHTPGLGTRTAFIVPGSLGLSGRAVGRSAPPAKAPAARPKPHKSKASRLMHRSSGKAPRSMPSILPSRSSIPNTAPTASAAAAVAEELADKKAPASVPGTKVGGSARLRGWSASSSAAGSAGVSPRLSLLN